MNGKDDAIKIIQINIANEARSEKNNLRSNRFAVKWKLVKWHWQKWWIFSLAAASLIVYGIAPEGGMTQNLSQRMLSSRWLHIFGTDALGRDLLLRTLQGGRISLIVGFGATAIAVFWGTCYGMLAGYWGGKTDFWLMRLVDVFYALPLTLIVLLLMIFFGAGTGVLCAAIGMTEWITLSRVVRAQTADLRQKSFVESAFALGQSHFRILFLHIFPNLRRTIFNYGLLLLPSCILLESFVSFLGLGIQPPQSSWGNLITDGVASINSHPGQLIFPSLFLILTVLALTTLPQKAN